MKGKNLFRLMIAMIISISMMTAPALAFAEGNGQDAHQQTKQTAQTQQDQLTGNQDTQGNQGAQNPQSPKSNQNPQNPKSNQNPRNPKSNQNTKNTKKTQTIQSEPQPDPQPNPDPQPQPDPQPEPTEPIKTTITGLPKTKTEKSRSILYVEIEIKSPVARTLYVEQYLKKKWKIKKKITTADTTDIQQLKVKFPNTWWKVDKTKWRLRLNASEKATACTTAAMTLKTKRYYQNPKKYLQIRNKISKHGKHYWTYPVKVNNASTRADHVNAMIKTAKKYLGDPYIVCRSGKPGKGVDCSGLVMQACYAAGADLWPSNPYRHRFPKYEYESRRIAKMKKLKTVSYKHRKKGDLIFYSKGGIVIHIAIYIGKGRIIHSWPGRVQISSATNPRWGHLCKVKRVFVK